MSTQMPCVLLTWIKLKKNKIKPNLTKTLSFGPGTRSNVTAVEALALPHKS